MYNQGPGQVSSSPKPSRKAGRVVPSTINNSSCKADDELMTVQIIIRQSVLFTFLVQWTTGTPVVILTSLTTAKLPRTTYISQYSPPCSSWRLGRLFPWAIRLLLLLLENPATTSRLVSFRWSLRTDLFLTRTLPLRCTHLDVLLDLDGCYRTSTRTQTNFAPVHANIATYLYRLGASHSVLPCRLVCSFILGTPVPPSCGLSPVLDEVGLSRVQRVYLPT